MDINWGDFFGSSLKRIFLRVFLGVFLFGLVLFWQISGWIPGEPLKGGFPVTFSHNWGPTPEGEFGHEFSFFGLTVDIIFWYIVMCLVELVYEKIKFRQQTFF